MFFLKINSKIHVVISEVGDKESLQDQRCKEWISKFSEDLKKNTKNQEITKKMLNLNSAVVALRLCLFTFDFLKINNKLSFKWIISPDEFIINNTIIKKKLSFKWIILFDEFINNININNDKLSFNILSWIYFYII